MHVCDCIDEVAEWLRRWTANPLRSACVGSNPILVDIFFSWQRHLYFFFCSVGGVQRIPGKYTKNKCSGSTEI